jgi:hypothetical protein
MSDSVSTVGYSDPVSTVGYSDSVSTVGYSWNDSDSEYEVSKPTSTKPWWETQKDTPDALWMECVKTWTVTRKATNTSPSIFDDHQKQASTQTGPFQEPISLSNLDAAINSCNLSQDPSVDYEVAAINYAACLAEAKKQLNDSKVRAAAMSQLNLRIAARNHRHRIIQTAISSLNHQH